MKRSLLIYALCLSIIFICILLISFFIINTSNIHTNKKLVLNNDTNKGNVLGIEENIIPTMPITSIFPTIIKPQATIQPTKISNTPTPTKNNTIKFIPPPTLTPTPSLLPTPTPKCSLAKINTLNSDITKNNSIKIDYTDRQLQYTRITQQARSKLNDDNLNCIYFYRGNGGLDSSGYLQCVQKARTMFSYTISQAEYYNITDAQIQNIDNLISNLTEQLVSCN